MQKALTLKERKMPKLLTVNIKKIYAKSAYTKQKIHGKVQTSYNKRYAKSAHIRHTKKVQKVLTANRKNIRKKYCKISSSKC